MTRPPGDRPPDAPRGATPPPRPTAPTAPTSPPATDAIPARGTAPPGSLAARPGGGGPGSRGRGTLPVLLGTALALVLVAMVVLMTLPDRSGPPRGACTVTAPPSSPGLPASYSARPDQMDNAATIAGTGRRLRVPDRGITIALATAIQESDLVNLGSGDRDSVGLFQQRPSQGWGDPDHLQDPNYATEAFYRALLQVPGWQTIDVTDAAQRVQHSGFPQAYADHEPQARLLAVAFLGQAPAALSCAGVEYPSSGDDVAELAGTELGTTRISGRQSPAAGWALSTWLVAHARRLRVDAVRFDGSTWTARSGRWTPGGAPDGQLTFHLVDDP